MLKFSSNCLPTFAKPVLCCRFFLYFFFLFFIFILFIFVLNFQIILILFIKVLLFIIFVFIIFIELILFSFVFLLLFFKLMSFSCLILLSVFNLGGSILCYLGSIGLVICLNLLHRQMLPHLCLISHLVSIFGHLQHYHLVLLS